MTNDRVAGSIVVSSLVCLYLSFGCFVLGAVCGPWSGAGAFFWAVSPLFGFFCIPLLVIAIIVRLSGRRAGGNHPAANSAPPKRL